MADLDFGHIIEGTVERDPLDDRLRILTADPAGNPLLIYPEDLLRKYEGQDVRFILASLSTIRDLEQAFEGQDLPVITPESLGASVTRTQLPSV